ncbi:MAG: hypothetical protein ACK5UQ_17640 [Planctomycetota bacterium]|jgi:hypothetical protein
MIRLGDSAFWVDATAEGWVLLEVVADKRQRATRRHGTFTSLRHVLQQRKVELPKGALRELKDLVGAMDGGEDLPGETPV